MTGVAAPAPRIFALNVLRGLAVAILIPDVYGGFSFYRMPELEPGSPVWHALARQFSHVAWTGATVWDMVMPVFVFAAGVAMALSRDRRVAREQPTLPLIAKAAFRSLTLVTLGMLLVFKAQTYFEEMLPFAVLICRLPLGIWWGRAAGSPSARMRFVFESALPLLVVGSAGAWVVQHLHRLGDYDLEQILVQLGLAYWPAFVLVGRSSCSSCRWWGDPIRLDRPVPSYPSPADLQPVGEAFTAVFAHWNNGTNVAAAFDRWLLNLLPRSEPYLGNVHGYHTLQFVPLIAVMLAGAMAGRLLERSPSPHDAARPLLLAGLVGLGGALVLAVTLSPLIKSLSTPSWTLFSTSLCALLLGVLLRVFDRPRRARACLPAGGARREPGAAVRDGLS